MLKPLSRTSGLIAIAATLAVPVYAQQSARPNESPWAMRPPSPQADATISAKQMAALKEAEKGTPAQQAFARKVSDAMINKDYGAIKDLFAPSTLKCIGDSIQQRSEAPTSAASGTNGGSAGSQASEGSGNAVRVSADDFVQDRIRKQLALPMSRRYKLTISKLPPNVMKDNKYSTYPMPATHLMTMEFDAPDGGSADTINLPIGQEDGKWYEVQPCPTQLGVNRFATLQQMQARQLEHAKTALAKVQGPIKAQLLTMVGKHDQVGAWKLCMSSLHYDFPTCHGVVELLAGQESD